MTSRYHPVNVSMPDTIDSNHLSPRSAHDPLLNILRKMKKRRNVPKIAPTSSEPAPITSRLLLLPAGTSPQQHTHHTPHLTHPRTPQPNLQIRATIPTPPHRTLQITRPLQLMEPQHIRLVPYDKTKPSMPANAQGIPTLSSPPTRAHHQHQALAPLC